MREKMARGDGEGGMVQPVGTVVRPARRRAQETFHGLVIPKKPRAPEPDGVSVIHLTTLFGEILIHRQSSDG